MSQPLMTCANPACGGELPARQTGRPATYCSTRCRQAAHRARQRAAAAVQHTTWMRASLSRDVDQALEVLQQIRGLLAAPIRDAERVAAATAAAGDEDWRAAPPTGWETLIEEKATRAARYASSLAGYAREHARSAAEHRQALPAAGKPAGKRRTAAPSSRADETPARPATASVATTAAAAATTKPAGVVDRGVVGPAERLAAAWADQSGAGPLIELVAAVTAVLEAVRPYEARWPATLAAACAAAETALAGIPHGR